MQWGAVRTVAAALVSGMLLAACTGCTGGPRAGEPMIGDIDPRNFVYRGACGWDKPAPDTPLVRGRQPSASTAKDAVVSRAQLVASRRVELGTPARPFLLVRLQCSIGGGTATGWHLLGYEGDRAVDLGIVAAAYGPISLTEENGQLVVEHGYRRTTDTGLSDSGRTGYRVALAGLTPVRLYGDEQPDDIPAGVADWGAEDWRAGLVTVIAPVAGEESVPHIGVQVAAATVLTPETLAYGPLGCRPAVVHTSTGLRIDSAATEGWTDRAGTRIRLALPTDSPHLSRVESIDPSTAANGLLVGTSGLVPALATADGTAAPDDVWLEAVPARAASWVLRDPSGAVVLAGSPGEMTPLPDTTEPSDVGCRR